MFRTAIAFILISWLAFNINRLIFKMEYHRVPYINRPGECRTISPINEGSEDIAITKDGLALISSGFDLEGLPSSRVVKNGSIFAFDMNQPNGDAIRLKLPDTFIDKFIPHGIDIWEDDTTDEIRLFVVNHYNNDETVEIFQLDRSKMILNHIKTVRDDLFVLLNDLGVTGPDSFFITNTMGSKNNFLNFVEFVFEPKWASVVYYDGSSSKYVFRRGAFPNGVAVSKDGNFVYVSLFSIFTIVAFKRNPDNSLTQIGSIYIEKGVDNLYIDPSSGDLWTGGMIIKHKHLQSPKFNVPCEVVRVQLLGPKDNPFAEYKLYDVFADDGSFLSAASSAAPFANKLLIGTIMDKLAICDLKFYA